ncbi:two-component response regulator ORR21-like [Papaver somniferum]|uniref:two-component response regulator ORR21-like n=1 Tax=Papaver somniferum TaxID=3469 RepID=UPI000E6FB686|nr:two-component response regulator ORR21-like [Papaver somniferum]
MLSSEFPSALPADEESKISREFSGVSISAAVDSMISTMRNEEGYPKGLKVLVVDEDHSFLEEIEPMLVQAKYTATLCSSATQALSMLHDKTRTFDIILMAILGSDMDGFKQIQQLAMEADLPIKYLLPAASPWSIVKTLGRKASKLTKPVRLSTVRTLWSNVARKRKEKLQKLVQEFRFLHVDYVEEHPASDMPFVEPEQMCDDDFWRMDLAALEVVTRVTKHLLSFF